MFIQAYYTTKGAVKDTNQDSLVVAQAKTGNGPLCLAAVCDGVGGLESGEEASFFLTTKLLSGFQYDIGWHIRQGESIWDNELWPVQYLTALLHKAGDKIRDRISPLCGTTCSGGIFSEERAILFHVGDSRIYRIRDGEIFQLTKDHTVAQNKVEEGILSKEAAAVSEDRHVLTQCVGASEQIDPDIFFTDLMPGDAFLMCTDGFWEKMQKDEVARLISGAESEAEIVSVLKQSAEYAIQMDETDNITALVLKLCGEAKQC